jgi:low affinity Fe/Cu permease
MNSRKEGKKKGPFELVARKITNWSGSTPVFLGAFTIIILWAISGPIFGFSDTWQLIINTSTTIITFLMVFLIQRAQNNDSIAIHLKLNELIAALDKTSNRLVDVEDLSEDELRYLHKYYERLADKAEEETDIRKSHSIEESESDKHPKKRH